MCGVVPAEVPGTGFRTTTLNEIPADRNIWIKLEEALIRVQETVQSACEILGLDLL
jgi:hydrogenase maturation factor